VFRASNAVQYHVSAFTLGELRRAWFVFGKCTPLLISGSQEPFLRGLKRRHYHHFTVVTKTNFNTRVTCNWYTFSPSCLGTAPFDRPRLHGRASRALETSAGVELLSRAPPLMSRVHAQTGPIFRVLPPLEVRAKPFALQGKLCTRFTTWRFSREFSLLLLPSSIFFQECFSRL